MSVSALGTQLSPIPFVGLSVGLSVRKMYCGNMADWSQMPTGVVSGVGRGMGSMCPKGKGRFCGFFVQIGLNGIFLNRNVFDLCIKS